MWISEEGRSDPAQWEYHPRIRGWKAEKESAVCARYEVPGDDSRSARGDEDLARALIPPADTDGGAESAVERDRCLLLRRQRRWLHWP